MIPPRVRAVRINRPFIIPIIGLLKLSQDGFVTIQGWAALNLLFGQIDGDKLLFFIYKTECIRGDQHLPARKPVACVGNQVPNRLVMVIEVEFFDLSDFTVTAVQFVTS